jgi:hypothetical protein
VALLREGYNVNTPIANFHASVLGVFASDDEPWDPQKHRVVVRITMGSQLRDVVHYDIELVRAVQDPPIPHLLRYTDTSSGTSNSVLTPGGIGQVSGYRLAFDPQDPQQGIFFRGADAQSTPAVSVAVNRERELIFLVPALPPGDYALEVRAAAEDSARVRAGQLSGLLTVLVTAPPPAGEIAVPQDRDS